MMNARAQVKHQTISAVITRVDGTKVDLGVIGFHHRNFIINFVGNAYIKVKRKIKGV